MVDEARLIPVDDVPHPLVDAVGRAADGSSWVITESRAPVIFVNPSRVNLLTTGARDGRRVVLVTDEYSKLTPLFAELWRDAGAYWIVKDAQGGMRDGFDGRRLERVEDAWSGARITSLDDVALNYLRAAGIDALEIFATVSMRLPARASTELGEALVQISEATIAAGPRGWGLGEPVGDPWDRGELTTYVRERMPADTAVCVGAPDLTGSIQAARTRHGIEEVTNVHVSLGEPSRQRLADVAERVDAALARLTESAMPLVAFVLARPARRDLLRTPFLPPPPAPLSLLVGPPGVRSLGLQPGVLTERFGARVVGRPRIPGLLFPLGLDGAVAWRRLDEILAAFGPALKEALGPAGSWMERHRPPDADPAGGDHDQP